MVDLLFDWPLGKLIDGLKYYSTEHRSTGLRIQSRLRGHRVEPSLRQNKNKTILNKKATKNATQRITLKQKRETHVKEKINIKYVRGRRCLIGNKNMTNSVPSYPMSPRTSMFSKGDHKMPLHVQSCFHATSNLKHELSRTASNIFA